jgi:hypothetical protein
MTGWQLMRRRGVVFGATGTVIAFAVCAACVLWSPIKRTVTDTGDRRGRECVPYTEVALGWSCRNTFGPVNHWDQCGQPRPDWHLARVSAGLPFAMMVGEWRDADSRDAIPTIPAIHNIGYRLYPKRVLWLGLTANVAVYGLLTLGLTTCIANVLGFVRAVIRDRHHLCRSCGYEVLDLPLCPECGLPVRAASEQTLTRAMAAQEPLP